MWTHARSEPFREDLVNEVQRLKGLGGELLRQKQHKRKQQEVMEPTSRVSNPTR